MKTGDAQRANQVLSSMEAVTADNILRVGRTYLPEDNRSVVVLKPVSPEESETLGALA
jgi:predicted Zn-dependent peptidase